MRKSELDKVGARRASIQEILTRHEARVTNAKSKLLPLDSKVNDANQYLADLLIKAVDGPVRIGSEEKTDRPSADMRELATAIADNGNTLTFSFSSLFNQENVRATFADAGFKAEGPAENQITVDLNDEERYQAFCKALFKMMVDRKAKELTGIVEVEYPNPKEAKREITEEYRNVRDYLNDMSKNLKHIGVEVNVSFAEAKERLQGILTEAGINLPGKTK